MPITLDGTNGITTPTYGGADTSEYLVPVTGFKNKIINGSMTIDQRNAGASVTQNTSTQFVTDRFGVYGSVTSKCTVQQSSTAPTGFNNSLIVTSSSAYTVGAAEAFFLVQRIEGFNTADLGFGTANAKTVTLSFWVRSSLTGTFGGSLMNNAYDRSYPFSYTISAANTWEQKSVTIVGDTTGTWVGATNGVGLRVHWSLGSGSTLSTTAGAWAAGEYYSATGATSVVGTNGATFYITGVQLEVGSTATSFDYRPYGTELALCQRYYETSYNQGNTEQAVPTNSPNSYIFLSSGSNTIAGGVGSAQQTMGSLFFKVQKRANPTVTVYSWTSSTTNAASNGWTGADLTASTGTPELIFKYGFSVVNKSGGNVTTGGYGIIFGYSASSEL